MEIVRTQRLRIPLVYLRICVEQRFVLTACDFKISKLQSGIIIERTLTDIRQQLAMRLEGIGAGDSCVFEHERDRGDNSLVGQGGGVEGKDGAVLFIGSIISYLENRGASIQSATRAAGFGGFEYPAVMRVNGF